MILLHQNNNLVHRGDIVILGVYTTTSGRQLMWYRLGEQPPLEEQFWKIKYNPLVITLNRKTLHDNS